MSQPPYEEPEIDFESISILIPRSKEGDQAARDALLKQIQEYLDLMAAKHMDKSLQPKAGPSDIVQQTLAQVIENFDNFRGGTAAEFRGWLKAIVVNEISKMRRQYRTDKRDIDREQKLEPPSIGGAGHPTDDNPTPSTDAMVAEQIEQFYEILDCLPADYATVIRLRSIEGLTFKEIAEKMERTQEAVAKLWYRAVLKFETEMKRVNDSPDTDQESE